MCRLFVGLNFIIRPTSILDWVPIFIGDLLFCSRHNAIPGFFINAFHGIIAIGSAITMESLFYNKLTYTAWNFFEFNVL